LAYYFNGQKDKARAVFQEIIREINIKSYPFFEDLEPVLNELEVNY